MARLVIAATFPIKRFTSKGIAYWKFRYLLADGTRRDKSLGRCDKTSKAQAERNKQAFIRKADFQPVETLGAKDTTLAKWINHFMDNLMTDRAEATRSIYDTTGRYLLASMKGDRQLASITEADADRFKAALSRGDLFDARKPTHGRIIGSPATVKKYCRAAKAIFNAAVRRGKLDSNPFAEVKVMVPAPKGDWHYVTHEEAEACLKVCSNVGWQAMVALCRWGGLRRNEARSLEWETVDLDARTMRVWGSKTERTKAGDGWRTVPINDRLLAVLSEARMVFGEHVATDQVGHADLSKTMRAIMRRAGVQWDDPFHDMRRARCQDLANASIPVKDAAEVMGHSVDIMMAFYLKSTSAGFNQAMAV